MSKGTRHPIGRLRRFLRDFLLATVCGVSFIIFLYWQADGIPRWFVFFSAGGGAYLCARLFGNFLARVERGVNAATIFIFLWTWAPVARAASLLFNGVGLGLKNFALFFIKYAKRLYTIYTAKKYAAGAVKDLNERKISAAMRGMSFEKEGK